MKIKPFAALRYDAAVVGIVGDCIAPPYDVINAAQQQRLYTKHSHNIVRITRGKTHPGDNATDNVYTRAGQYLRTWMAEGAFKKDAAEMLYAYVQDFAIGGQIYQRSGIVALGQLEEFGKTVKPHERTLEGPKADRLNLTRATAAQFGQIFMLYDDPQAVAEDVIRKAAGGTALIDFVDDENVRHRLYPIEELPDIEAIVQMMLDKDVIIADGHHRYETAVNYWRETGNPNAGAAMMTFVNMRNPGLVILPTHRLVDNIQNFVMRELLGELQGDFDVDIFAFGEKPTREDAQAKMFDRMKKLFAERRSAFGLYAGESAFYVASLKNPAAMDVVADHSKPWRMLDVSILHKLILEDILGIGEKQLANETNIEYIKDIGNAIDESIRAVDTGEKQAVFFMNPTRIEEVRAVAAEGEKMPQKSTFFHPKVYTGLTINKID